MDNNYSGQETDSVLNNNEKNASMNETSQNITSLNSDDLDIKNEQNRHTIPKVDRYGFIVSHRLHGKVSSLPNTRGIPSEVGKRREVKWLDMISDWDTFIERHPNKVKLRCAKGIPQSVRSLAWQHLSGAIKMKEKNVGLFEKLLESADLKWSETIKKDIPRTFRHHCMFNKDESQGAEDLYKVLLAYSSYNIAVGYNQAMAPIAAVLLMHMTPEESFWVLVSICKYYLPGYYGDEMEAIKLDGQIFEKLLDRHIPHISRHMKAQNIDPLMYIVEWMVCIFARCLPFETVLRIWDIFFCDGVKALFKIGLAILKLVFPTSNDLNGKDDFKTTQILLELPKDITRENILIPASRKINISETDFERLHKRISEENSLSISRFYSTTIKVTEEDRHI